MSFKEVFVFILIFVAFLNASDFIRLRWQTMSQIDNGISLLETVLGVGFLSAMPLIYVYLTYYSFTSYRDVYGVGMAMIASILMLVVTVCIFRNAISTLKSLSRK